MEKKKKSRDALGTENRADVTAPLEARVKLAQILATSVN